MLSAQTYCSGNEFQLITVLGKKLFLRIFGSNGLQCFCMILVRSLRVGLTEVIRWDRSQVIHYFV